MLLLLMLQQQQQPSVKIYVDLLDIDWQAYIDTVYSLAGQPAACGIAAAASAAVRPSLLLQQQQLQQKPRHMQAC